MPGMASRKNPFPACAAVIALCAAGLAPPVAADSPPEPFDAKALQAAIDATPDGGTVRLPDGEIRLARSISVVGRTNLTVRGGAGTVLVLRYSPWEEPVGLITPHILVKGCSGVSFEGFRVTTDNPVNASGRVVSKNPEDGTYEAEIDPRFPITGWEHVYGSDTFDEEGMPDYAIETYDDRNVRTQLLPDGKGGVIPRIIGLDYEEHGLASAYADFMPTPETPGTTAAPAPVGQAAPPAPVAIRTSDGRALTRVSIVTSRERFDVLKAELEKLNITGMTVTQVLGYGLQKGHSMYRGAHVASRLLPKLQVDLVVSAIPPRDIIEAAKRALYTGHYGDGKIFVSTVDNVIKIRTGEEGFDALQDKEIA